MNDSTHSERSTEPLLLTQRDAARVLAVSVPTLRRMTAPKGPIPCIRLGPNMIRYALEDLRDWVQSMRETSNQNRTEPADGHR